MAYLNLDSDWLVGSLLRKVFRVVGMVYCVRICGVCLADRRHLGVVVAVAAVGGVGVAD